MGSPGISPVLADMYMEDFEATSLTTFEGIFPSHWYRYVDNTWVKIQSSELDYPLVHKLGVIRTLYHPASYIPSTEETRGKEHQHLRKALQTCGYKDCSIEKALHPSKNTFSLRPLVPRRGSVGPISPRTVGKDTEDPEQLQYKIQSISSQPTPSTSSR